MSRNNYRYNWLINDKSMPWSAYVILTLNCNSKCDHCYVEAGPGRKESMPMDLRKKIIDEVAKNKIGCIEFSGGEPTVEMEKLIDTLSYANETRAKTGYPEDITLQTNAYFLKGLKKSEIKERLEKFKSAGAVCLDITSNDEYHNISEPELKKIRRMAKKVFGRGNVALRGRSDGTAVPIGRAREKVPRAKWDTENYYRRYDSLNISVDGKVYPCCWQATPPMGDLSTELLSEIIEHARKPDGLFRKLAKNGGFSGLDAKELGISEGDMKVMVDEFGNCGACHQYFKRLKNGKN